MMEKMSALNQRWLAVVLLLLSLLLLSVLFIRPLWGHFMNGQREIEQIRDHITRFEQLQVVAKENEKLLKNSKGPGSTAQYLLPAETPTLAAARLQKLLKSVIVNAGGELVSSRSLPLENDGLLQQVGVGIKIQANIDVIQRVLHTLESRVPVLKIDEVSMLRRQRRRASTRQAKVNRKPSVIEMRFNVSGYLQPSGDVR